jgi:hypothetical protein
LAHQLKEDELNVGRKKKARTYTNVWMDNLTKADHLGDALDIVYEEKKICCEGNNEIQSSQDNAQLS